MNRKLAYLISSLALACGLRGQTLTLNLAQASCQMFKGHLYCYGISNASANSALKIYKLDARLKLLDSISIEGTHYKATELLRLYSDTLHGQVNIYVPKKEKKALDVYHFSGQPALLTKAEDVEVARLNNTSLFSAETYFFNNTVYSVKTNSDSSGLQFYLNKYELKKNVPNFDYEFIWQYPFERKNVHSARILFADSKNIFLYVTISTGAKAGQWLLKINTLGKLVKGTKLNGPGEHDYYALPAVLEDKSTRSLWLGGQKLNQTQIDCGTGKLNIDKTNQASLYLIEIDSLEEVVQRHEFKVPITEVKNGTKKVNAGFLFRVNKLVKKSDNSVVLVADIYRSNGEPLCYFYSSGQEFNIVKNDEKFTLAKTTISANPDIERFYLNNDKLDMNGRICIDSAARFERLFHLEPVLPVKLAFKTDELGNPSWLLKKSLIKKNSIQYATLMPIKKIYMLKPHDEVPKASNPMLLVLSQQTYITAFEDGDGKLRLNLHSW